MIDKILTNTHLRPAEVVGCGQQSLHFMAEPWTTVTHLHAALSGSPLKTILCNWRTIARWGLEGTQQETHKYN